MAQVVTSNMEASRASSWFTGKKDLSVASGHELEALTFRGTRRNVLVCASSGDELQSNIQRNPEASNYLE